MHYTTALTTLLLTTGALAAPTVTKRQDAVTYQISSLTERKYDGTTVATVFFNIISTSGGDMNTECAPYDATTKAASDSFEAGRVYPCGANSLFSFSYWPGDSAAGKDAQLNLWQSVSDSKTYVGRLEFGEDELVCHAGGSTTEDLVCSVPPQVYQEIQMSVAGAPAH